MVIVRSYEESNRILCAISPCIRIVVPMPVVIEPGLSILVLPLKPQWLRHLGPVQSVDPPPGAVLG